MTNTEMIVRIICIIIGALCSLIPAIITFICNIKKRVLAEETSKNQLTEANEKLIEAEKDAENANAKNDMVNEFINIVSQVENTFQSINNVVKAQDGKGIGEQKKEVALSELSNYANAKGYEFDKAAWSAVADNLVTFANSFKEN